MRQRLSLHPFSTALFAALGIAPFAACSGTVVDTAKQNPNGADAGRGGGGGTAGAAPICRNPTSLAGPRGEPTGFVQCEGGSLHRVDQRECPTTLPRAGAQCPVQCAGGAGGACNACATDADCTEHPNGYCTDPIRLGNGGAPGCSCAYGCTKDSDCGPDPSIGVTTPDGGTQLLDRICVCGDPVGHCATTTGCTTDADCGGRLCLSADQTPCEGQWFACQSGTDNCASNADCPSGQQCGKSFGFGSHQCGGPGCVVGRPFLVSGAVRVAEESRHLDWASLLATDCGGLGEMERRAIAERWTEIGLMEHASIAAFARFALELLSLGAPPELLIATQAAMTDEIRHAKDAFALASAYLGRPIGPGKLDVGGDVLSRSPLEVVQTAILEGCIGETIAAAQAAEALAHATEPSVRAALASVAEDEMRHSELAWRFVQWVMERGEPSLRGLAAACLLAAIDAERGACRAEPSGELGVSRDVLLAHGVVGDAVRLEILRRVIDEVVAPCARALVRATRESSLGASEPLDADVRC